MDEEKPIASVSPCMRIVPALMKTADMFLDGAPGEAGVIIGGQFVPFMGPIVFIGIKEADGCSRIGLIPKQCWPGLRETIDQLVTDMDSGAFDKPEVLHG